MNRSISHSQGIVARNVLIMLASQIVVKISGFVFIVLLTNYLDVDNFGHFNFLLAYAVLFTPLCDIGIDFFVIRNLAIHPEQRSAITGTSLGIKALLIPVSIIAIAGSFVIIFPSSASLSLIVAAAAVTVLRATPGTLSGIFRASQQLSLDSYIQISAKLFDLTAIIIALWIKADIFLIFQILFLSALLQIGFSVFLAHRRSYLNSLSFDWHVARYLVRGGIPFVLTSISVIIFFHIDTVMLSAMVGEHETGLYRSVTNIAFALNLFSAAIAASLFPMVAQKYSTERAEAVHVASNAMFYSFVIGFPIAVGATILADPIIHFLYRDSFAEASSSLRVLIWWIPVSFTANTLGHILGAIGQQKKVFYVAAINAVFNISANLYFIPKYGAVGASLTTVATDLLGATIQSFIVTKHFGWIYQVRRIGKTFLASLFLVPLILLSGKIHLLLLILFGIIIYTAMLFIMNILSKHDIERVKKIIIQS
jgi:O-antigen/teichoic acid export membrane protein